MSGDLKLDPQGDLHATRLSAAVQDIYEYLASVAESKVLTQEI